MFYPRPPHRFDRRQVQAGSRSWLASLWGVPNRSADRRTRTVLTRAELASGSARRSALFSLASMNGTYAPGSSDAPKVRLLARSIADLMER